MATPEISGRSDAPERLTCSEAFTKISKSVTYQLGTHSAYPKLFCSALVLFRMPFRKMRVECGYGKEEKWTLGEQQEQDRKGDNRKNTEIKGAPLPKAKNQEREVKMS